jgi:hypothetical protein
MAESTVTTEEKDSKPTNKVRENLVSMAGYVEALDFLHALESAVNLQKARGVDLEPKHMLTLIHTGISDAPEKVTAPIREYLRVLLEKDSPVPPEQLINLLGIVSLAEERVRAVCKYVETGTDFLTDVLTEWAKKCGEGQGQPEEASHE